jgi:ribonuclease D
MGDDLLLDLVKSKPKNLKDIKRRRGFNPTVIDKHGAALLECIQAGLSMPKEQWPETGKGKPLTANQEVMADILMGLLKQQAKKNEVSVASMASRKEVERLARGKRDIALMSGWRYELGGKVLIQFLEGKISLGVADRQLVLS